MARKRVGESRLEQKMAAIEEALEDVQAAAKVMRKTARAASDTRGRMMIVRHPQRIPVAGLGGLVGGVAGSFGGPLGAAAGAAIGATFGSLVGKGIRY